MDYDAATACYRPPFSESNGGRAPPSGPRASEPPRHRLLAAERTIGDAEEAQFLAKHEAKEARIELDEYEAELRRKGRFQRKQAEEADKWSQIAQGIAANNAMHSTDYPEYWEPGRSSMACGNWTPRRGVNDVFTVRDVRYSRGIWVFQWCLVSPQSLIPSRYHSNCRVWRWSFSPPLAVRPS